MKGIRLSLYQVIFSSYLFWLIALPVSYFLFGDGPHSNLETAILSTILAGLFLIGARCCKENGAFPVFAMLSYMALLHFFPRIWQYLSVNREGLYNLYVLFPFPWSSSGINAGLIYLILGTAALIAGLVVSARFFKRNFPLKTITSKSNSVALHGILPMTIAGIIIYLVDGYFTIYRGMSASSNCTQVQVSGAWLIHFFSGDIFIFIVMAAFGPRLEQAHKKEKAFFWGNILIYIIYTLLLGSRGGVLRLLTIFYSTYLVINHQKKFHLKKIVKFCSIIFCSGFLLYFLGNSIRLTKGASCGKDKGPSLSLFQQSFLNSIGGNGASYTEDFSVNSKDSGVSKNNGSIFWNGYFPHLKLPNTVITVFDRLGLVDYTMGISSIEPNEYYFEKYINFSYMIKNFTNNIVLGEPYPEAHFMTANFMPLLYRGRDFKHVEENFLVDAWTIWGSSLIHFGFLGAVYFLLFVGASCQAIYESSIRWVPEAIKQYFVSYFLWLGMMGVVFSQMSFDHAAILIIYGLFQFIVTMGLVILFSLLLYKFKKVEDLV